MENDLMVVWEVENVEHFGPHIVGSTIESPVFSGKRSESKWQLVLNIRDVCSSSLCLRVHPSSAVRQLHVRYHFGIVNNAGDLEYECTGESRCFPMQEPSKLPTLLFDWKQIMESKSKLFSDGKLRVRCSLYVLDYVNRIESIGTGNRSIKTHSY